MLKGHHECHKKRKEQVETVSTMSWLWGTTPTHGKVQLGPKQNPVLSFQFASLLVSKLLIFLYDFEVLEGANQARKIKPFGGD